MTAVGRLAALQLLVVGVIAFNIDKKRVDEAARAIRTAQSEGRTFQSEGRTVQTEGASKLAANKLVANKLVLNKLGTESQLGVTRKFEGKVDSQLGVMNKLGVTRYSGKRLLKAKSKHGAFWPDSTSRANGEFVGAQDLTDNVSWGWHHPNGVYNTIPVGAPLIDSEMNIYIGSDDAIRKFNVLGDLLWSYAPRGQLAAAPTLALTGSPSARIVDEMEMSAEEEESLKPSWVDNPNRSVQYQAFFRDLKVGDRVKVRPGFSYHMDGKEMYRSGDMGKVFQITGEGSGKQRAVILWKRTGTESVADLSTLGKRFFHVRTHKATTLPRMLVGSTTSGYVFAIGIDNGEEIWATQMTDAISGMKGAVAAKDGVVVAATNRCVDRYCYRYRNQTNAIWPANSIVRGLNAEDGSAMWYYQTRSPVWNMVPQWGLDDTVMFQDQEANAYSLKFKTGELVWMKKGQMGTTTEAAALYLKDHNILVAMGPQHYKHKYCNPYPAPGILTHCSTWPKSKGLIRGLNASSGRMLWSRETGLPPASAAAGKLNSPVGHYRLVVTTGFNCRYSSASMIIAVDPFNGAIRWSREGPTLWTGMCAGDKEGGDIRRAMGGRAACRPNSWSLPAIDANGDLYIGSQVGELQRWGSPTGATRDVQMLSALNTGVAFNDMSIAFAPGIMAVSTCTSLIILRTSEGRFETADWTFGSAEYTDSHYDNASHHFPPSKLY